MKSKRFLSFVLVFAMLMSLGITVFADAMPSVGSSEVTPITENEFAALFGSPDASADYSYNISSTNNDSVFRASLSAAITANNREYQFSATGEVDMLELSDGSSILNGPLYGEAVIDGIAYPFTAGFTKAVGENKINVGIAINPTISSSSQVLFAFGERVMADNASIVYDNEVHVQSIASTSSSLSSNLPNAVFNYVSAKTAKMANMPSVNGQKLSVYYASNTQTVGTRVQTYTGAINSYYTNAGNTGCSVKVNKITIKLERSSASNASEITNIDSINTNTNSVSSSYSSFGDLVCNLLSDFGIPTSTFASALRSLSSNLSTGSYGDNAYVTCKYSLSDDTSILNNSGMCVAFNLRNKVTTAFSAPYIISSQTEYRVSYTIPLSGPTSFYASANSASMTQYFALRAGS